MLKIVILRNSSDIFIGCPELWYLRGSDVRMMPRHPAGLDLWLWYNFIVLSLDTPLSSDYL